MRTSFKYVLALATAVAAAYGIARSTPYWFVPRQDATVDIHDPALIARGQYLARAADCAACHTAPGGRPFAGGLGMQTPMGTLYATNITPDAQTGIGRYDYADFERAVRRGIRRDQQPLYPAMPYVSYMIASDEEIKALYAYFMGAVKPVKQDNADSTIPWPANLRWPLSWWQLLFARPRTFTPDPSLDAGQQRGAQLVEGLAHCGACHTPRGMAFQEKALADDGSGHFLSGSVLEGWYAKNLRNEATGLASWSEAEIVDFLRTGRTGRTAAFGGMAEVVEHSTQYLSDADLLAMARYLKQLPPRQGRSTAWTPGPDTTTAALRSGDYQVTGALAYAEHCQACHRADGRGMPRVYPALAGNSIVFADDASSLVQVTLAGGRMPQTPHDTMAFSMPGFAHLRNEELARILTFIRNSWGNHASPVSKEEVARMRAVVRDRPAPVLPVEDQP
ncbi:cytochrome c [Stenotrophomonas sp. 24(2023)]|uniref:c-type cytochrome n=1 Tax=Stenotrophomonas sp. 24(2023) TaxID=3068324 RepID=UPI0027DEB83C|nr:cytochrome c [Stenotrophomonas sp. 24(2023)]WMJ68726.1 cytochrome c [Stenotrophomonas sp. 24(2023)]